MSDWSREIGVALYLPVLAGFLLLVVVPIRPMGQMP